MAASTGSDSPCSLLQSLSVNRLLRVYIFKKVILPYQKNHRDLASPNLSIIKPGLSISPGKIAGCYRSDRQALSKLLANGAIIDFCTALSELLPPMHLSAASQISITLVEGFMSRRYVRAFVNSAVVANSLEQLLLKLPIPKVRYSSTAPQGKIVRAGWLQCYRILWVRAIT